MTGQIVRLAVLTDLHVYSDAKGSAPSWISLKEDQGNPRVNPFAGLRDLIRSERLAADIVLCCGDMGDKADPDSQQYAWREICGLREILGAQTVLGTAGNHDLDSRYQYTGFDARGQVQALEPGFPIAESTKWMEYWAQNFTTIEFGGARIVLLNSAAYHGYGKDPPKDAKPFPEKRPDRPEFEHGRVSNRTIDRLVGVLSGEGERAANILVCHHHPYKNDQIKIDDYSEMEGGERLINQLVDADLGPWLVIHGHKHMPRIFYAPGGNVSPTVFAAGSFSARLYAEFQERARNEFYILTLEVPAQTGLVTSLRGDLSTWNWSFGDGWVRPRTGEGLGPRAAFGARVDLGQLASEIATHLKNTYAGSFVSWSEVQAYKVDVGYLIPDDLKTLLALLKNKHGLKLFADDETGLLAQIQVPQ